MRTYEPMGHSQAQTRLLAGYPSGLLRSEGYSIRVGVAQFMMKESGR